MESNPIQTSPKREVSPAIPQPATEVPVCSKPHLPEAREVEEDAKTESPVDEATRQMLDVLEEKASLMLELVAHPNWYACGTKVRLPLSPTYAFRNMKDAPLHLLQWLTKKKGLIMWKEQA